MKKRTCFVAAVACAIALLAPTAAWADSWERVAGNNQYDTMAQVCAKGWTASDTDTVILATGENFPDALAAAGIAGLENAPVLITESSTGKLSAQTASELKRLKPKSMIAVGGLFALPAEVVEQAKVAAEATDVVRLAGDKASDTAAIMNKKYASNWGSVGFLATSLNYPDALSAAPVAYSLGMPIYLVDHWDKVSNATYASMAEAGINKLYVLGGIYCVSDDAIADLEAHGIEVLDRLAGDSRYDTSCKIALWALEHGMDADGMGVACGLNYPDALTGAAFCGKNGAVMVLADSSDYATCLPIAADNRAGISKGYVFGGEFAVAPKVYRAYAGEGLDLEEIARDFVRVWYDDWTFENGEFSIIAPSGNYSERCLPFIAQGTDLYNEFANSSNFAMDSTSRLSRGGAAWHAVDIKTEAAGANKVVVEVFSCGTQNYLDAQGYQRALEHGWRDRWTLAFNDAGKIISLD